MDGVVRVLTLVVDSCDEDRLPCLYDLSLASGTIIRKTHLIMVRCWVVFTTRRMSYTVMDKWRACMCRRLVSSQQRIKEE